MRLLALLLVLLPVASRADTLYLCESYGGGSFWSGAYCGQHKASVKRIVNVPDDLSFEQQVELGEQVRADERRAAEQAQAAARTQTTTTANTKYECAVLDKRIRSLDATARQPQSGSRQDQIRAERSAARDRQAQLRCR